MNEEEADLQGKQRRRQMLHCAHYSLEPLFLESRLLRMKPVAGGGTASQAAERFLEPPLRDKNAQVYTPPERDTERANHGYTDTCMYITQRRSDRYTDD